MFNLELETGAQVEFEVSLMKKIDHVNPPLEETIFVFYILFKCK